MVRTDVKDSITEMQAAQLSPLALAFVGDTVFDLHVRTYMVLHNAGNTGQLHIKSSGVVNARAQAVFAHRVQPELTERERNIYMRGRNAKSATVPKNMSVTDYRYATAIEAVMGYLYLTGQEERLQALLDKLEMDNE